MKLAIPFTALLCMLLSLPSVAIDFPIEATTADKKVVLLYEDGTWRPKTLQLDHSVIRKGDFSTKKLSSKVGFYEFWYDPKAWVVKSPEGTFEYLFEHKSEEAWCGVIPERIQMTKEALANANFYNLRFLAPDATLVQKSKAFVNGLGGEAIELKATMEGYYLSFYTFAWTGAKGTVRLTCWTSQNLLDEYRDTFHDFFGGFLLVD